MPVSPREAASWIDPVSGCKVYPHNMSLNATQASVLAALAPIDPTTQSWEWPMWNRAELARRAGFTTVSGTLTRVLNGISHDSKVRAIERGKTPSGEPHPGLLARKFITEVEIELESKIEVNYQITEAGLRAHQAHVASGRKHIPRNKATSVNTDRGYKNPHLSK